MNWRLIVCCMVGALSLVFASADSLVVAGQQHQLTTPLIIEGDEVLAPATSALRQLGVRVSSTGTSLTTPQGTVIKFAANSTVAYVDDRRITLGAAPRVIDDTLYLPVRSLASYLQVDSQYDTVQRSLKISPLVQVTYETRSEGLAVLLRSSLPVQFTSGRITGAQPRIYFDLKNVSLGLSEQQIPCNDPLIQRLRISQYSSAPDVVRIVFDLTTNASATATISAKGQLVTILTQRDDSIITPATPPTLTMPAATAIVQLQHLTLTAISHKQSTLDLQTDGPIQAVAKYNRTKHQLVIHCANAINALPPGELSLPDDRLIEKVQIVATPNTSTADLTITLAREVGYQLQRTASGLRILVGAFSLEDLVIVLDAGHGGNDSGAVGYNGTQEKDVNLDVILRAAKLLRNTGAKVLLTRESDVTTKLQSRPEFANNNSADLFVSVHCNSSPTRNSGSGTQTYYTNANSVVLANAVHGALVEALAIKDSKVQPPRSFCVTRESSMPAILLELAFINNAAEEALLATAEFRQRAAEGIVNGIRLYASGQDWAR